MMLPNIDGTATSSCHPIDNPDFTFPFRLFLLLKHAEEQGMEHVISWTADGKGFKVHDPSEFESAFLAENFRMKKYASFTRQLCAYGFSCVRKGRQPGLYFHPKFTRNNPDSSSKITRGSGKAYAAFSKKTSETIRTITSVPQSIPVSPLIPQGMSSPPLTTTTIPSTVMHDQQQRLPNNLSISQQMEAEYKNAQIKSMQNIAAFPSMLLNQNTPEEGSVLKNFYKNARRAMAWQKMEQQSGQATTSIMESSGRISPESCNSSQSSDSSPVPIEDNCYDINGNGPSSSDDNNIMIGGDLKNQLVMMTEDPADLIDNYDAFEPIPLSKIKGMEPISTPALHATHCSRLSNDNDLLMFEPRPIEDMVDEPRNGTVFYSMTPSISPRQQAWMEYSMPVILPILFYTVDLSQFGLMWCFVLVSGHTLQTLFTSFGPDAKDLSYKPAIEMLQHNFMDTLWMQSLYTAMLLMPQYFDPASVYVAAALIPLLPFYLSVSLKAHFEHNVLDASADARTTTATARSIKRKLRSVQVVGEIIDNSFTWYFSAVALILLGHYVACFNAMVMGVFVLNTAPLSTFAAYTYQFQKSATLLKIHKQKVL